VTHGTSHKARGTGKLLPLGVKPRYRRLASNGALREFSVTSTGPITPKSQKYRRQFRQFRQTVQ
jgi:hypothetical protein